MSNIYSVVQPRRHTLLVLVADFLEFLEVRRPDLHAMIADMQFYDGLAILIQHLEVQVANLADIPDCIICLRAAINEQPRAPYALTDWRMQDGS